ncbi:MAG: heavy metal translocating P-type ATPase [Chloroflexi bacterium]|nr:heavy metal translocating P-type ATPase [Chloroflexota bacterium]
MINSFSANTTIFRKKPLIDAFYPPSVNKTSTRWQQLKQKVLAPFQSETRREQRQALVSRNENLSPLEKRMNHFLNIATVNLGIAGASLFFPPLILATVPLLAYLMTPILQLTYKGLVKQRRFTSYTLDALLLGGMLLGGFWYTATIGLWVLMFSRKLLVKSENNAKQNLVNLFGEQPRTVWVQTEDGVEVEIPFNQLQIGDVLVISAGQMIPVDGVITAGMASIDQHKLTGEAQPAEKGIGEAVLAATVVLAGRVHIRAERAGADTVAMQIGQILEKTADFKNSLQSRGEAIADKMALPTLGVSLLLLPLGLNSTLAVLTNTFGLKMRLFGPASMLTYLNLASHHGALIKDGRSLELLQGVDTVVFDKTGTLTLEQPTVDKIHLCDASAASGISDDDILRYAAAAEAGQPHPIAKAILTAARQRQLQWPQLEDAKYEVGYGIQVRLTDCLVRVGSSRFMDIEGIAIPAAMQAIQDACHAQGHSLVMVALDDTLAGAIELQATIRPEAQALIVDLQRRGMTTYIISGDQEAPTQRLAQALGIDHYFANTLPENKANLVEQLQQQGRSVCFVGDGINDAIALKKANVSISLRGATTVATDTAQIVLIDGTLNHLNYLFDLVQDFEATMKTNLLISTIPSAICLGGILFFHWGVFAGILLTQATLFTGIGNSMLPLWKQKSRQDVLIETKDGTKEIAKHE